MRQRARFRQQAAVAAVVVAAVTIAVGAQVGGEHGATVISDVGAVLGAAFAAVTCALAARRLPDERRAWGALAVAAALWCGGEVLWGWFEVVLNDDVPFPSIADAAYLAAVPVAAVGLLRFARRAQVGHRLRMLLDGALVGGSVLFVAWALVLGDIWKDASEEWLAHAVSIAYPVTDVALVTLAVLAVAWGKRRGPVELLAVGIGVMGLTDSAFLYLTAHGTYSSASWITSGWLAGYVLLGLAALAPGHLVDEEMSTEDVEPALIVLLPYVPISCAFAVGVPLIASGDELGPMLTTLAAILVIVTLGRQGLIVLENRRLAQRLAEVVESLNEREAELARMAWHDPLTGLPNRRHFSDRLTLELTPTLPRPAIIYIDLDGFKDVNDKLGHGIGDEVLVLAAARLVESLPEGTLAARLGGDEFVALIPDGERRAGKVARSVVDGFSLPFRVRDQRISISASVGIAMAPTSGDPEEALRRADAAMYAAKRAGKARAVAYPDESIVGDDFPGEGLPLVDLRASS